MSHMMDRAGLKVRIDGFEAALRIHGQFSASAF